MSQNFIKACACLERYAQAQGKIYCLPNYEMSYEKCGIVYLSVLNRTVRYSIKRDALILPARQRAEED